jgi:hypothetical protein
MMSPKINVANPTDRSMLRRPGSPYGWRTYILAFGAYGSTYVLAYAHSLEDASPADIRAIAHGGAR